MEGNYKQKIKDAWHQLWSKDFKKQIPNLLTVSRIFSPLVILPLALSGNYIGAACAASVFGLTDTLDGFIARKYDAYSELGRELDAVSDKVFATTLMLPLAINFSPLLFASLGLEAAIGTINVISKKKSNNPQSEIVGKCKTWSLFSLVAASYLSASGFVASSIPKALFAITAGLQTISLGQYSYKFYKAEKNKKEIQPNILTKTEDKPEMKEEKQYTKEDQINDLKEYKNSLLNNSYNTEELKLSRKRESKK